MSARIIQVRPSRHPRCYGHREIQVLNNAWNVAETITNEDLQPLV